jgi:hypothetical protein
VRALGQHFLVEPRRNEMGVRVDPHHE